MPAGPSETEVFEQNRTQEGHGEPQNLNNLAAVSRGIMQTGLRNLAKFSAENCGPYHHPTQVNMPHHNDSQAVLYT